MRLLRRVTHKIQEMKPGNKESEVISVFLFKINKNKVIYSGRTGPNFGVERTPCFAFIETSDPQDPGDEAR